MVDVLKIIGAFGLVVVIFGILAKHRKRQATLYIIGGLCLEAYSLSIGDAIFIILQGVFTLAAAFDLYRQRSSG